MPPLPRTFDNTLTAGDLPQQTPPSSSSLVSIGMTDASHEERKRMASANDHSVQSHSAPLTSGDEEEMEDDGSYVSHEISLDDDFRADGDLQSLVDSVLDPHAVDFQPLLTSLNGAAMTPSHSMHSMMSEYEEFGPHAHEMGGSGGGYASSLDLGQQLAFAAGHLRIMLSRGLGAMQRHGKHYGNRLLASVSESINAVGSNGGGGRGSNGYHGNDLRGRILSLGRDAKIALIVLCAVFAIGVIGKFNSTSSSVGDVTLSIHSDADKFLNNLDLSVPNKSKIRLPRPYDAIANVADRPLAITDTPVYWEIPRSGSTTMINIAATCFAKVVASEVGELDGHATDATLQIIAKEYGNFVNVDTTRPNGIARAQKLGLIPSRIAGAIFSPYAYEISSLFDQKHKGRFFTMMRDPISRIVSKYYYQQVQGLLPSEDITIVQFVAMNEDNWMTRMLTNKMTGKIGAADLDVAKEILRRKFLIGLWEDKTESMRRIEQYFGWKFPSPVAQNCKNDKLYFEWDNKNPHPSTENEDELILQIQKINRYDVELYAYAKQLYREQEELFWTGSGNGGIIEGGGLR